LPLLFPEILGQTFGKSLCGCTDESVLIWCQLRLIGARVAHKEGAEWLTGRRRVRSHIHEARDPGVVSGLRNDGATIGMPD
jgi:hypothetical protein